MIKIELHAHTADDPADRVPHTATELIDRAAHLGYGALAVTLHNRWWDPAPLLDYAAERGIVLISGIERSIGGRHLLLVNTPAQSESVRTFHDVRALKRDSNTLVIAPHAFYPIPSALGPVMDSIADLIDAVEVNAMHVLGVDFNRGAVRWADAHDKPLVGNCDLHRLGQLGSTYSVVDVPRDADADTVCAAIRCGRVRVETRPLGWLEAFWHFSRMEVSGWGRAHLRQ